MHPMINQVRARFYATTGHVPNAHALDVLLSDYSEPEISAAWVDYSSKRLASQMASTVKQFFEDGDAVAVLFAIRMGLPLSSPDTARPGRPDTPKFIEAQAWLQDALQDGAVTAKKLFKDALDGAGIKADTVRAAGKALGIKPEKRAEGWLWELPAMNATASTVSQDPESSEDEGATNPTGNLQITEWGRAYVTSENYAANLARTLKAVLGTDPSNPLSSGETVFETLTRVTAVALCMRDESTPVPSHTTEELDALVDANRALVISCVDAAMKALPGYLKTFREKQTAAAAVGGAKQ
jgi:hypothetical protein